MVSLGDKKCLQKVNTYGMNNLDRALAAFLQYDFNNPETHPSEPSSILGREKSSKYLRDLPQDMQSEGVVYGHSFSPGLGQLPL